MREPYDALCIDDLPEDVGAFDDGIETWSEALDYWLRGEDDVPDCG